MIGGLCIVCDRPARSIAAFVLDVRGNDRLGIGMCSRCTKKNAGGYSDETSEKIHARYVLHPERYLAEMEPGRLH